MKYIKLVFFLLFSINQLVSHAQYAINWQKNIGGTGADFGKSICMSKDSSCFYIAGYTNSTDFDIIDNHGGFDIFVSKINLQGNVLWTKTYGGAGNDYVQKITLLSDNDLLICGFSNSDDTLLPGNHGGYDVLMYKIDTLGTVKWKKLYGGSGDEGDHSMSVKEGANKCLFVITGAKSNDGDVSGNHGNGDFWLFKTDSVGSILWQKCYGGSGDEDGHAILPMNDGGFVLSGHTLSDDYDVSGLHSIGKEDGWLLRVDSLLNIKWQKCFGGTDIETMCNMCFADSGNIVLVGYTKSNDCDIVSSHGDYDVWVVKADTSGNLIWSKTYGGSAGDYSYDVFKMDDGGFLIGGYTNSTDGDLTASNGGFDYWLFKIDNSGDLIWQKTYGGSLTDKEQAILPYSNNEIVMTGFSNSNDFDVSVNKGGMDCWVFKTACQKPEAGFIPSSIEICDGDTISFVNSSSGAVNYSWHVNESLFSNELNTSISFPFQGNNTVTLVASFDNCSDTFSQTILVKPMPVVDIGNDTAINTGNILTLDAGNAGAIFNWSTGEHTQSINIFPPGVFSVDVNLNGCNSTDTIYVDILTGLLESIFLSERIQIFPNPFTDKLVLMSDIFAESWILTIKDIRGVTLLQKKIKSNDETIEAGSYGKGVYFIVLSGKRNITFKVVKL
jgi:hypothetical protein